MVCRVARIFRQCVEQSKVSVQRATKQDGNESRLENKDAHMEMAGQVQLPSPIELVDHPNHLVIDDPTKTDAITIVRDASSDSIANNASITIRDDTRDASSTTNLTIDPLATNVATTDSASISDTIASSTTSTTTEPQSTSSAFEVILPIMSRLPIGTPMQSPDELPHTVADPGYLHRDQSHNAKSLPFVNYTTSHLPSIDAAGHNLWRALHALRPISANYAGSFVDTSDPTPSSATATAHAVNPAYPRYRTSESATALVRRVFNWSDIRLPLDTTGTFHGVIFRSKRRIGSETTSLYAADRLAHEEAVNSGGLLMYWFGVPDSEGMNLATCIWRDRESSVKASALEKHREAVGHAREAYATFEVSRYVVEKRAGESGVWVV